MAWMSSILSKAAEVASAAVAITANQCHFQSLAADICQPIKAGIA